MVFVDLLEKVTDTIYAHTEGKTIGNVGLIATETGNYIVDTSMYPVIARELRTEVETIRSGKVKGVILTHYHFDHSGGNQHFHDVPIYAHKHVEENMVNNYLNQDLTRAFGEREDKDLFEGLKVTKPTHIFETNPFSPEDSDQIEMYRVGGHTNGSTLVYYKEEKAIFAGDDLFAGLYPWGGDPSASPYEWINAMDLLLELKPKYIIPGHGPVQTTIKEVEMLRTYLQKVVEAGKKLQRDAISQDEALLSLSEIDHHPEHREGLKEGSLKKWIEVVYNH